MRTDLVMLNTNLVMLRGRKRTDFAILKGKSTDLSMLRGKSTDLSMLRGKEA